MSAEQFIQSIKDFFVANPNMAGLLVAALGVLLFIGTIFQWKWVLSPGGRISLLSAVFGVRGQMFIYSSLIIIGGIALFLFI